MLLTERHPHTGLPLVQETRTSANTFGMPRSLEKIAKDAEPEAVPWFPRYLEWQSNVLSRVRCWKCGRDLCGWKPVIDQHGQLVKRDDMLCLWFREYDHARKTPFHVRWGALNLTAQFTILHCADCQLEESQGLTYLACFLAGHASCLQHAWNQRLGDGMDLKAWVSYNYRWSESVGCQPVGFTMTTKDPIVKLATPGKPMMPDDYLNWLDRLIGGAVPSGVVVEYENADEPPPGWTVGPRPGTIKRR